MACLYAIFLAVSSVQSLSVDVTPAQATVHEEDSITIRCVADYTDIDSSINFTWFHEDDVLANGGLVANANKHFVTMDGETASILRIADVNREDRGPYTCVALDIKTSQTARSTAEIIVLYTPAAHYPQCFVQNSFLQSLSDIQEGTSLTLVCSSDVASPLPVISWFRSDTEQTEYIGGTIVVGDNYLRNEITVIVTEEFQGASFECRLESAAFSSYDQRCTLGPISVLSDRPTKGQPREPERVPKLSTDRLPTDDFTEEDHYDHGNKKADGRPVTTSSITTVASPCLTTFSFADKAMVPTTIILAILLLISVVVNVLQMVKISELSSKKSNLVGVRHQVIQENSYMTINRETVSRPSIYTDLNMRSSLQESVGDYYEYDMPDQSKPAYEDMSGKEAAPAAAYEDASAAYEDASTPAYEAASAAAYEDVIDGDRPQSVTPQSRPTSKTLPLSTNRSLANQYPSQPPTPVHTYERSISALSGQYEIKTDNK